MHELTWTYGLVGAILAVMVCAPVVAQEEDPSLAGVVTAVSDKVQKIQADGETVELVGGDQVFFDDKLVTPASGGVWLALREKRGVVQLGGETTARFLSVDADGQPVSMQMVVERGRATLMTRSSDARRLVVVAGDPATGYALVSGGSLTVDAGANLVTLSARSGDVLVYKGALPEAGALTADGAPAVAAVLTLAPGESVNLADLARSPAVAASDADGAGLYAMGLRKADQWVAKAEQGDFTPQRVEARGGSGTFLEQASTGFSFDQARPPVAVTTRANTFVVSNVRVNPAEALVGSRVPTSVVVGARFLRTRIIGNPGTGESSLSANPFAGRLIVLGN